MRSVTNLDTYVFTSYLRINTCLLLLLYESQFDVSTFVLQSVEKNVLPSADDVKAEKTTMEMIKGIESFDKTEKLKEAKTREPAKIKNVELYSISLVSFLSYTSMS